MLLGKILIKRLKGKRLIPMTQKDIQKIGQDKYDLPKFSVFERDSLS